jgi:CheY-like chemotaxis protein
VPSALQLPGSARVLIVDDNATNREILRRQVTKYGLNAEAVGSGADALRRLAQAPAFQLVLLDWHMPAMTGLELAIEIRANLAWPRLPLVMLSSAGPVEDLPAALAVGFAAMLTKPVREEQLHRCIARLLGSPAPAGPASLQAPLVAAAPGKVLRLLLAEDNPANQIVARMLITKMGHMIDVANNGFEALAKLAEHAYDAVLMDCQMPVLDGYEATRRIRSGSFVGVNPRVPIIALTAYAMADDRSKCLGAGMDDYVSKPIRSDELVAAFQRCGLATGPGPGPATVPRSPAGEVLDLQVLENMRALPGRSGPSLLPELIALFLHETPVRLEECTSFAAGHNLADLARTAHLLAGSCASVGANPMRTAALALERAASVKNAGNVAGQLAALHQEWQRAQAALEHQALQST